jgi:hypothetical protein
MPPKAKKAAVPLKEKDQITKFLSITKTKSEEETNGVTSQAFSKETLAKIDLKREFNREDLLKFAATNYPDDSLVVEYFNSLDERGIIANQLGIEMLKTSYDVHRTKGYQAWLKSH